MLRSIAATLAAVCLPLLMGGGGAHARDLKGHLGLGGYFTRDNYAYDYVLESPTDEAPDPALVGYLSLKYWVSDLGLQGLFGFAAQHSTADTYGYVEYRPAVRVLFSMTRTRLTNLYVGAGVSSVLRASKATKNLNQNPRHERPGGNDGYLDLVLGAEIFLGEVFAVAGEVKLTSEFGDPLLSLGSGSWGLAFHYYF